MPGAFDQTDAMARLRRLSAHLRSRFREWREAPVPWTDADLDALGHEVFDLQYRFNRPYRKYCDRRHVTPDSVTGWKQIPPVPTEAFRVVDLVAGDPAEVALTFLTSGTTRGVARRGRHLVLDPELYRASLRATFDVFALPEYPVYMCALHEPFAAKSDSSLAWMLDDVMATYGEPGWIHAAGPDGLDHAAILRFCETAVSSDTPVLLLGTTRAFDDWLEWLARKGVRISLPTGSRVMDTGGAKGREGMSRESVLEGLEECLAVGRADVINEFGMTELLSQRYSASEVTPDGARLLVGPPWLRTRSLDPITLEDMPDGEPGILCHFDLANVASVSMVLTEDVGIAHADGIEWLGRTPGAPPRGCSLATAELLEAQHAR